jgi:hypothetical protein
MVHPYQQKRYFRKVIQISAEDSPNVQFAKEQLTRGIEPDNRVILEGVVSWAEYSKRRQTWDPMLQCIGLDGMFYEGQEVMLYPKDWLKRSHKFDRWLGKQSIPRIGEAIGIDPGEGIADTAWSIIDRYGIIDLISLPTPDTSIIPNVTLDLMKEYKVPPHMVIFDSGGGGKMHADWLRSWGYPVRTVGFGQAVTPDVRKDTALVPYKERVEQREDRYTYSNRRAQMYGDLRELLSPSGTALLPNHTGFAIPKHLKELVRQLSKMPLLYDKEGRLRMLSKNKTSTNAGEKTLVELLGCSPDQADSLVLAVHAITRRAFKRKARVIRHR